MPSTKTITVVPLGEMLPGQEADLFALLSAKETLTTRDNKPYLKVTFRDAKREVAFPIWGDSAFFIEGRDTWQVGMHFKLRALYRETSYGPQLDIKKIRPVCAEDSTEGFDPWMCLPRSRYDCQEMFDELIEIAEERIADKELRNLVLGIYKDNQEELLALPAATRNHHAYIGGYLEHVRSVTKTAIYLADKYDDYYDDQTPRLSKELVVAGAMLHDIGKLREIGLTPGGAAYTNSGHLIGHICQGRDIIREAAAKKKINAETLLRLEHIILSHQRLPEWGSPKPPMTPEALLVHYADDIDAKYHMMYKILNENTESGSVTSKRNALYQQVYKGEISADNATE